MTITDSSLSRNLFTDIRSTLVTALGGSISVNSSFNDKAPSKPQIILRQPLSSESNFPFNGTEGSKSITVVIDVYDTTQKSMAENVDTIRAALKANDIAGISLESIEEDYDFNQSQSDKFHLMTLSCNYVRE